MQTLLYLLAWIPIVAAVVAVLCIVSMVIYVSIKDRDPDILIPLGCFAGILLLGLSLAYLDSHAPPWKHSATADPPVLEMQGTVTIGVETNN